MSHSESDRDSSVGVNLARERGLALLLLAAALVAYFPALRAGFIWDDDRYVTHNRLLTTPDGLLSIWFSQDAPSQYVPLTYTSFWLEYSLWGLWSKGYHFVNVLLHAVNAVLLWRLLRRLVLPGAWLAAALFMLHPVQVESVAWISERKNVLSLFFMLLAGRAWVEFIEAPETSTRRWYQQALIFQALALVSKATACTLPAALVVVLWLRGKQVDRRRMVQLLPFVLLGLGMGLAAMWWERHHQGTDGGVFGLSLLERILVASRAIWFYLGKLFWPSDLTFIYPQWMISTVDPWAYAWLLLAVTAMPAIYWLRRCFGGGIGIAGVFYVAMLSPLLGFIMLYTFRYTFVADHYQYVASIGPLTLIAAGLALAVRRLDKGRPLLQMAICGALLVLGGLTWKQAGIYQNNGTLWRDTLAKNPECWMAENNLGNYLAKQGEVAESMNHYEWALRIKPDYAEAHYNLAGAFAQQNRLEPAIAHLEQAVRINPGYVKAHNNLGVAMLRAGRLHDAIGHLERAIQLRPGYTSTYLNLATALSQNGQNQEAIVRLRESIAMNPEDRDTRRLLKQLEDAPMTTSDPQPPARSALPGY